MIPIPKNTKTCVMIMMRKRLLGLGLVLQMVYSQDNRTIEVSPFKYVAHAALNNKHQHHPSLFNTQVYAPFLCSGGGTPDLKRVESKRAGSFGASLRFSFTFAISASAVEAARLARPSRIPPPLD